MNQTAFMGGGQPEGNLPPQSQDFRQFEWTAVDALLQVFAGDVFHDQERHRLLFDGMNLHDIFMTKGRDRAGFAGTLAGHGHGDALRRHHFDGHDAVQPLVKGFEDDAEATLAEHVEHLVVP